MLTDEIRCLKHVAVVFHFAVVQRTLSFWKMLDFANSSMADSAVIRNGLWQGVQYLAQSGHWPNLRPIAVQKMRDTGPASITQISSKTWCQITPKRFSLAGCSSCFVNRVPVSVLVANHLSSRFVGIAQDLHLLGIPVDFVA